MIITLDSKSWINFLKARTYSTCTFNSTYTCMFTRNFYVGHTVELEVSKT